AGPDATEPGVCVRDRGGADRGVYHFFKMNFSDYNSLLTVLIFSPLAAGVIAGGIRDEAIFRWGDLAFSDAISAFSFPLYWHFDPTTSEFQFKQTAVWVSTLKINYAVGIDGISLLLVLLTTLIMPLCVLCSWRYIKTRVKEFMICLLIMETAMIG